MVVDDLRPTPDGQVETSERLMAPPFRQQPRCHPRALRCDPAGRDEGFDGAGRIPGILAGLAEPKPAALGDRRSGVARQELLADLHGSSRIPGLAPGPHGEQLPFDKPRPGGMIPGDSLEEHHRFPGPGELDQRRRVEQQSERAIVPCEGLAAAHRQRPERGVGPLPVLGRGLRGAPPEPEMRRPRIVAGIRHQRAEGFCRRGGIAAGQQRFRPDRADVDDRRRIGRSFATLLGREREKAIGRRDRLVAPSRGEEHRRRQAQARRHGRIAGMLRHEAIENVEPLVAPAREIDEPLGARKLEPGDDGSIDRVTAAPRDHRPLERSLRHGDGSLGATCVQFHPRQPRPPLGRNRRRRPRQR